jgi:hypothetical protein
MNIHLIRSSELNVEIYANVWNLLRKFQGPLQYFESEDVLGEYKQYDQEWLSEDHLNDIQRINFSPDLDSVNHKTEFDSRNISLTNNFDEKIATWEDFFATCEKYRSEYKIPDNDLVFLLTDISNDKNWFGASDKSMRNVFIQTSNWSDFFGAKTDERFPVAYEVVVWILRILMYDSRSEFAQYLHPQPKGCMMDFCEDKAQIILKMRTADICSDCLKHIQSRDVSRTALNQILETMDGIRGNILFRERSAVLNRPSKLEIRGYMKRIFLSDLGDLEIHLNPKEKTLFLFFLNHPEGVRIVDLIDYKDEILTIYKRFSRAATPQIIEKAVNLMLQPTEGNINQVLTRIRSKFRQSAGESISTYYTIEGIRNEPYKIALNRELIVYLD